VTAPRLYDYTSLSALLSCEQEWDYRYRQHLARPTPEVSPLFGQAVHAGVRALFDGAPKETVSDAVASAWGDFVAPEKKAHLNLAYAQAVVEQYREAYFGSNAAPFELVLNERYLEWPERSLCGIVDRVVRSKQDGQLYVMDLKTTGLYLGQAWFEQWRHSLQAAIYLDLVEHELTVALASGRDTEPGGVAPLSHGKTVWPVTNTGGATVAGFWVDAIHLDRRGYPKREDFMRVGPFPYSAELRKELRLLVNWATNRARGLEERPEQAWKNPKSCFRFNALCPFFSLCTLDPSNRPDAVRMALASGDFVQQAWEPKERA
jgi:hypothetical protein